MKDFINRLKSPVVIAQIAAFSDGRIGIRGSTAYPWKAGDYVVLVGW